LDELFDQLLASACRYGVLMALTSWAVANAERFLSPLGSRWSHVRQTGELARRIARVVPPADRDLLVAAAYLHDVGYAPELAKTGFHPLDGARWIRDHGPGYGLRVLSLIIRVLFMRRKSGGWLKLCLVSLSLRIPSRTTR
jgi:HD domain